MGVGLHDEDFCMSSFSVFLRRGVCFPICRCQPPVSLTHAWPAMKVRASPLPVCLAASSLSLPPASEDGKGKAPPPRVCCPSNRPAKAGGPATQRPALSSAPWTGAPRAAVTLGASGELTAPCRSPGGKLNDRCLAPVPAVACDPQAHRGGPVGCDLTGNRRRGLPSRSASEAATSSSLPAALPQVVFRRG